MAGRCPLLISILCLYGTVLQMQSWRLGLASPCSLKNKRYFFHAKYFRDGDYVIGGVMPVNFYALLTKNEDFRDINYMSYCNIHLLAIIFAVDEINGSPDLLPNVTLGYHMYDSCNNVNKAIESVLQIMSGHGDLVPNYSCLDRDKLAGVIFYPSAERSLHIVQILNIYGYPTINFGPSYPVVTSEDIYPSFFQTFPCDQTQNLAIVKLLLHFGWTWIGVIASDDDAGEKQSQEFERVADFYKICIEYSVRIPCEHTGNGYTKMVKETRVFKESTSKIIVVFGTTSFFMIEFLQREESTHQKTLIIPAGSMAHKTFPLKIRVMLNGCLVFSPSIKQIPPLRNFLEDITLTNRPDDILLKQIAGFYLGCKSSDQLLNQYIEAYNIKLHTCNESAKFSQLASRCFDTNVFGITYQVYKAVYAMAHSLHEIRLYMGRNIKSKIQYLKRHKYFIKSFLSKIRFRDPTGEEGFFTPKREMSTTYEILNYVFDLKQMRDTFYNLGMFGENPDGGEQLVIYPNFEYWKNNEVPVSVCSADCPPGKRRVQKTGRPPCCFDCVNCPAGEISNHTDKGSCQKCPEDQWPNNYGQCVPKPVEYLAYTNSPVLLAIFLIIGLFLVITIFILVIFFICGNTPVIRASNQHLSIVLLVSIMLSFPSVFLFLGHPVRITCMLRHIVYGVLFSVAVSCILAKTVMVYMAFKATKPGTSWKKFIGLKIPICLVLICSFFQIITSIIWLSVSPPFPEANTDLYLDRIIILCNEGSVLAFSVLLGYMGLLALVSFIVAFLVRNLPDSFNEAKYITFSMLLFCSVWITFIPAYLSVTGTNTTLVEIFAIISSSAGTLACIFFPKCYIVLMRPDLNVKSHIIK